MDPTKSLPDTWFQWFQFSSVQLLSRVRLFVTPWIAARQASLSVTNTRSSLRLTSIESVMPSSHLILSRPLFLLPPVPPIIRVFSSESTLCMRWPKYWITKFETFDLVRQIRFGIWVDAVVIWESGVGVGGSALGQGDYILHIRWARIFGSLKQTVVDWIVSSPWKIIQILNLCLPRQPLFYSWSL